MAQPLPALFHSRWSAPEVPGCKSSVLQGSMCVISTWNRETHPQERWCEHNSTAPSPGAHGNVPLPNNPSTSRVMACKEELGAETRVILKPTFTWEARKEALESLSLMSVVFSPSPTLHIMLTARPRLHQENSAACSKFCLPGLPGDLFHPTFAKAPGMPTLCWRMSMEFKDMVRKQTTWGLCQKTWFLGKVHYKRAVETNTMKTTVLWQNFITPESLVNQSTFSGCILASLLLGTGTSVRKTPEQMQAGDPLSFSTKRRSFHSSSHCLIQSY